MSTFGLWWFKWNGSNYESRMKVGSREATVQDFKNRGFDYLVTADSTPFNGAYLSGEGSGIEFSGHLYDNGYTDGRKLATFLKNNLQGIEYLAPIPYYKYKTPSNIENARDYWRGLSYTYGWIDGVVSVDSPYLGGFYWDLENPTQTYGTSRYISTFELNAIRGRILENDREYGLELKFTWVPTLRGRSVSQLEAFKQYIMEAAEYFDYVFFQPHYYQCQNCSIEDLESLLEWLYNFHGEINNVYVEFEADKAVCGEYENCGCGTGQCCISKACEYSEVIQLNSYNELVQYKA